MNSINLMYKVPLLLIFIFVSYVSADNTKMVAGTYVEWKRYSYNNVNYKIKKKYNICPASSSCTPSRDPGILGGNLLEDVKHNKLALAEAETYRKIAITSTVCIVGVPLFGALAMASAMSGDSEDGFNSGGAFKPFLGLAIGSLAGWWITSFLESNQLEKVAKAYNENNTIKLNYNLRSKNVVLSYDLKF